MSISRLRQLGALLVLLMLPTYATALEPYGFLQGDIITPNTNDLNVRTGPGTSYGVVQSGISSNAPGNILDGPTASNGYYWWRVKFYHNSAWVYGWSAQNYLELISPRDEEDFAGGYVEVDGAGSGGLNARENATVDDDILDTYSEGTVGAVVGGPFQYQAYVWWRIRWPNNVTGWSIQRYLEEAPEPEPDTTPPTITRLGSSWVDVPYGSNYSDAGATAYDDVDGNITQYIHKTGLPVDTTDVGQHYVWYNVADAAGNDAQAKARTVNVLPDEEPPPPPPTEGSATVFGNTLGSGWYDDSWGASFTEVDGHMQVSFDAAAGELRFNTDTFDTTGYNLLSFYVKPNSVDEQLYVHLYDENGQQLTHLYIPYFAYADKLRPYIWQVVRIPLDDLNATNRVITGIGFQLDYVDTIDINELRFNTATQDGGTCNAN